jgi:hypothetical protein
MGQCARVTSSRWHGPCCLPSVAFLVRRDGADDASLMESPEPTSGLSKRLKTSLDELRMQVLGAQVLLGFQFQCLFQERFQTLPSASRVAAAMGLVAICLALAGLIAPPAQHRLVEQGDASLRLLRLVSRCAEVSLAFLTLALGSDVFVTASLQGSSHPLGLASAAIFVSGAMWFGFGRWTGPALQGNTMDNIKREAVDMHAKIEQMLTESRVILPGSQAMLGFQLIVTMTNAFNEMSAWVKSLHFVALGAVILSVVLLITPAAVHRLRLPVMTIRVFFELGLS